jgi:hypothetical protein
MLPPESVEQRASVSETESPNIVPRLTIITFNVDGLGVYGRLSADERMRRIIHGL